MQKSYSKIVEEKIDMHELTERQRTFHELQGQLVDLFDPDSIRDGKSESTIVKKGGILALSAEMEVDLAFGLDMKNHKLQEDRLNFLGKNYQMPTDSKSVWSLVVGQFEDLVEGGVVGHQPGLFQFGSGLGKRPSAQTQFAAQPGLAVPGDPVGVPDRHQEQVQRQGLVSAPVNEPTADQAMVHPTEVIGNVTGA